jgi:hypothetical protein
VREWENFYVIVGSAAAALTGLQFVAVALMSDLRRRATSRDIDAYGTPTIVHFGAVILSSAIASVPWPTVLSVAIAFAACGTAGVVYMLVVHRRAHRANYQAVTEDWIWHVILPFAAYVALLGAGLGLLRDRGVPLFVIGASSLLLLFVGIHNTWDAVTWMLLEAGRQPPKPD